MEDFEKKFEKLEKLNNELREHLDELDQELKDKNPLLELCNINIKFNPINQELHVEISASSPLPKELDKKNRFKTTIAKIAELYKQKLQEEIKELVAKYVLDIAKDNIDLLDEKNE